MEEVEKVNYCAKHKINHGEHFGNNIMEWIKKNIYIFSMDIPVTIVLRACREIKGCMVFSRSIPWLGR
jgi:hypothetical protein